MSAPILQRHRVTIIGNGSRTMVLAHGFGTTQQSWRAQVAAFRDSYRVVRFDLAGAVSTDLSDFDFARHTRLAGYVADLLEIMAALDLRDTIYVGHSMSGVIGLLAARAQPDRFQHLICISASPRYLNDRDYVGGFTQSDLDAIYEAMAVDYSGWVVGFAPLMMRNAERPKLAQAFCRSLLALSPTIARSVVRVIFQSDCRSVLPEVSTPTLLIQSASDPAVPPAVGRYMAQALPHATLCEIEADGHFPQMSAPDAVNAAIRAYLAGQNLDSSAAPAS